MMGKVQGDKQPDTVEIYVAAFCGYCTRACALLDKYGVTYTVISLDDEPRRRVEMIERSRGKRSVPQIFIKGKHVGGCDDLYMLHEQQKLQVLFTDDDTTET